jgi:hypothetical protein
MQPGVARSLQPALHLSCERISPLPYQLLAIGLVLAGNLPLHLKNQEVKLPRLPVRGGPWGMVAAATAAVLPHRVGNAPGVVYRLGV